jgi:hypothetical protein
MGSKDLLSLRQDRQPFQPSQVNNYRCVTEKSCGSEWYMYIGGSPRSFDSDLKMV